MKVDTQLNTFFLYKKLHMEKGIEGKGRETEGESMR